MQFKGKLINQTWEHGLISGPIFARLAQIWAPDFFAGLFSTKCQTLSQATIICNFKENLWYPNSKNDKKPYFGSNLVSFGTNSGRQFDFFFLNHFREKNVEQLQNERTQKM